MSAIGSIPGRPRRHPPGRDDGGGDRGLPRASTPAPTRGCWTRSSSGSSSARTCSSATRRARATTRARLEPAHHLVGLLGAIHQYTVMAFREGDRLRDPPRADQRRAAHRHPRHALRSPSSTRATAACTRPPPTRDYLRDYDDPPAGSAGRFPAAGRFDPRAFDSGMDYSTREASAERHGAPCRTGTSARSARCRATSASSRATGPGLLKAYRDRYEHAIRDSLPKQMLPWLLLNYDVVRGFRDGIRENVLLGRALGMTREQLLDAICYGVLHAGVERARHRRGGGRRRAGASDGVSIGASSRRRRGSSPAAAAVAAALAGELAALGVRPSRWSPTAASRTPGARAAARGRRRRRGVRVCGLIGEDPDVAECERPPAPRR